MTKTNARLAIGLFICAAMIACAQSQADRGGRASSLFGGETVRTPDFVSLAKILQPSVVNVSAMLSPPVKGPGGRQQEQGRNPPQQFFGIPTPPDVPERSQGSGFIIDSSGIVLTNAHVVDRAKKIVVRMMDKREFEATVVGRDLPTDIALLKITTKERLPTLTLGDSDNLQVGEWIMAVGNPFGLDSSVSSGIVSAKGRHLGEAYDRLIQTDASLNPGSSGGPLVNLKGQVVGISKAIVSQGGGNIGISFATPINLIKEILPELQSSGKVTRGWAGVAVQEITPGLAETLGMEKASGALVSGIVQGGPAQRSGMRVGDVITEFDGKQVIDAMDLPLWIARTPIDKSVGVKIQRERQEVKLQLTLTALPEPKPTLGRENEIG